MNLRYENDLMREGRLRGDFRNLLMELSWITVEGGVLDRLHCDTFQYHEAGRKEFPAKQVKAEVDLLLASSRESIKPHHEMLVRFGEYVDSQIEREKAVALADKLVAQVIKAGVRYSEAQSLFLKALDRKSDAFDMEGW